MRYMVARWPAVIIMVMYNPAVLAVDSYRYAHVTIETPWMIFLFLLAIILLPFVLMAILYWYFATKKDSKPGESE